MILMADIDRGGVFARWWNAGAAFHSNPARVQGMVPVAQDLSLLEPGLRWLERRVGKPVLGVLPYLHGMHLEAEDAINPHNMSAEEGVALRAIVPVVPHISNHTDFDPLRLHPQVSLTYVGPGEAIPPADLVLLPGSKNVRRPQLVARQRLGGRFLPISLRAARVIGICGGFGCSATGCAMQDRSAGVGRGSACRSRD